MDCHLRYRELAVSENLSKEKQLLLFQSRGLCTATLLLRVTAGGIRTRPHPVTAMKDIVSM
jgi:hypothetical protein